ncbi:MAG: helix-turn-helix domain-containing protein [Armatimonadota bacterium]|jgi:Zn-dependent peptidase ImmA (M78 family)/DNA-binding XRE family transcriptional regulator
MLGQRIKQIRMAKGLSQQTLAEKTGCVTKQAISNYETDKNTPSSPVLIAIADALDTSVSALFQRISVTLGEPAYRKRSSMGMTEKRALQNHVALQVEHHLEAEAIFSINAHEPLELPDSVIKPLQDVSDAENRAEELRKHWELADHPIKNLVELLEDKGILVVCVKDFNNFDGCTYPDSEIPIVVVNEDRPGDRFRFDLAHELAHLVLRFPEDWDKKQQETAAHRFAAAFLVPASAAMAELVNNKKRPRITGLELNDLKLKYGMSIQAWYYRAKDLGIISENAFDNFWKSLNAKGLTKQELGDPYPLETTSRHRRLVARAYADGRISESRAAELLGVSVSDLHCILMDGLGDVQVDVA